MSSVTHTTRELVDSPDQPTVMISVLTVICSSLIRRWVHVIRWLEDSLLEVGSMMTVSDNSPVVDYIPVGSMFPVLTASEATCQWNGAVDNQSKISSDLPVEQVDLDHDPTNKMTIQ